MRQQTTIDILNDVLRTIYRSLPMFISEVDPYTRDCDEPAEQALAHLTSDAKVYSGRVAEMILDLGGPQAGPYPMEYMDLHLLSLDYLFKEVIAQQEHDIVTLQTCVDQLKGNDRARTLAEEILGNARGHLQSLKQLVPAATTR